MPSLGARIIACGFLGAFALASLVLLAIAVGSTVQRATLIFSGSHADGTVVAKKQVGHLQSGAAAYAPMVQFTAGNGRTYVVSSDLSGAESAYQFGQHLRILYPADHPDDARIDAFAPLWTLPLVAAVAGAAFSIVPAIVIMNWIRPRRSAKGAAAEGDSDRTFPGLRWALGIVLIGGGLALVVIGLRSSGATDVEARVLGTSLGVLLAATGALVGQWVTTGSRTYHALGALVTACLAIMFGWVAVFGHASRFSVAAGVGAVRISSGGGVMAARIAFGIVSVLISLLSLWGWGQVLRRSTKLPDTPTEPLP